MSERPPEVVGADLIGHEGERPVLDHLEANRRLIIRRSLLATAAGGIVPLPILDDYVAARVRAGLYMQLARRRNVDLPAGAAELLAEEQDGTALRNATLTAATMIALKLAWRKFFAVLALGRRAEDMASTFQMGTLFDHYAARLHVGAAVDRPRAFRLHLAMTESIARAHKGALVGGFREGARVLGQSALEAPRWAADRLRALAHKWAQSGGQTEAVLDGGEGELDPETSRWLDRASAAVDARNVALGDDYLGALIQDFERRHRLIEEHATRAAAEAGPAAEAAGFASPEPPR